MTDIAFITGASRGIGAATAAKFIAGGFQVVNLSRRTSTTEGVDESLTGDLAARLEDAELAAELAARAAAADRVVLIHNAAQLINDAATDVDPARLESLLRLNLVVPAALNRTLLPVMKPGSAVLYVGSTLAEKAVPNSFSYVTSKHGQLGMMRATCQDLAGTGIHTAMVCPGFTDTEMLRDHVDNDADVLASVAGMSAYGRLVEPAEIAEALWFCAINPVVNGTVMHANLGQVER